LYKVEGFEGGFVVPYLSQKIKQNTKELKITCSQAPNSQSKGLGTFPSPSACVYFG